MDTVKIQKIIAMNRYRSHQLINNLIFYTSTALVCSLLCSIPFWLPSLSSLPKLVSLLLSSKSVFVIGSLIIIFLVGDSKALTSEPPVAASEVLHYDEYGSVSRSLWGLSDSGHEGRREVMIKKERCFPEQKTVGLEWCEDGKEDGKMEKKPKGKLGGDENLSLPELNRRADDFIARVNRRMKLEAAGY